MSEETFKGSNSYGSTALLIGAGFSLEMGMPLVWDLTNELRAGIGPVTLNQINMDWRFQSYGREGHPQAVIDALVPVLADPDRHYEQVLEWLQNQHLRSETTQEDYWALYQWFTEMVSWILYMRHDVNESYARDSVPFYRGLGSLIKYGQPLWIFSLNHDLCVEFLAAELGIALSCGIGGSTLKVPRRDSQDSVIGETVFDVIPREQLNAQNSQFLTGAGINLVKLHGALDVFTFEERNLYVRIRPQNNTINGWLEALRWVNTQLIYMDDGFGPVKGTNHIVYKDHDGEVQVLPRSILAGGYKFDARIPVNTPPELLRLFATKLEDFSELAVIGYGFGDAHINDIVCQWLRADVERRLLVVDPRRTTVPECVHGQEGQVTLVKQRATEFLDELSGNELGPSELLEKTRRSFGRGIDVTPAMFTESLFRLCAEEVERRARRKSAEPDPEIFYNLLNEAVRCLKEESLPAPPVRPTLPLQSRLPTRQS